MEATTYPIWWSDGSGTGCELPQTSVELLVRCSALKFLKINIDAEFFANDAQQIHLRDGIPFGHLVCAGVRNLLLGQFWEYQSKTTHKLVASRIIHD